MSEFIDADALIKDIENDCPEVVYYTKRDAIDCIQAQPTADVVAVVRCKDCKRCKKIKRVDGTYFFSCRSGCFKEVVSADHYCSYGERREE